MAQQAITTTAVAIDADMLKAGNMWALMCQGLIIIKTKPDFWWEPWGSAYSTTIYLKLTEI